MTPKTIVICGGHFSPAQLLIDALADTSGVKIVYIGTKYLPKTNIFTLEYKTLSGYKNISYYIIAAGKLHRNFSIETFISLLLFPIGALQSLFILLRVKPNLTLSFGGYIALTVCLVSYLLRIPVILHEQTKVMGLANRIISKFAKIVCISWYQTENVPSGIKPIITGNLIKKLNNKSAFNKYFFQKSNLPVIYITGGNQGSRSLNKIVSRIVSILVKHWCIIHQCGVSDDNADYKKLSIAKSKLPISFQKRYQIIEHIPPFDTAMIMKNAKIIISRAGANTVTEVAQAQTPAIFIPLPWSASSEQYNNAKSLSDIGIALVLDQYKVTDENLLLSVRYISENYEQFKANFQKVDSLFPLNGLDNLINVLESEFKKV